MIQAVDLASTVMHPSNDASVSTQEVTTTVDPKKSASKYDVSTLLSKLTFIISVMSPAKRASKTSKLCNAPTRECLEKNFDLEPKEIDFLIAHSVDKEKVREHLALALSDRERIFRAMKILSCMAERSPSHRTRGNCTEDIKILEEEFGIYEAEVRPCLIDLKNGDDESARQFLRRRFSENRMEVWETDL